MSLVSNQVPVKPCHVGTPHVFTDPTTGQKWYAGGSSRNFKCPEGAVLVALTSGLVKMPVFANIPLVPMEQKVVSIDWGDGTAGPLKTKNQYLGLLRALRATGQDVAVACVGGHGRTGTFLAMNAYLMDILDGKKPVEFIRKIYCEECVESKVQFELLAKLTGFDETSLFVPFTSTYYGGWDSGHYSGGGYYGASGYTTKKGHFLEGSDPDSENLKHGYFWGRIKDGSVLEYEGYPTGKGEWMLDTVGWFWQWDHDNPKPTYRPVVKGDIKSPVSVKPEDEAGTFDDDSGYGYVSDEPKSQTAQQFLNDYYSGKKNKSA